MLDICYDSKGSHRERKTLVKEDDNGDVKAVMKCKAIGALYAWTNAVFRGPLRLSAVRKVLKIIRRNKIDEFVLKIPAQCTDMSEIRHLNFRRESRLSKIRNMPLVHTRKTRNQLIQPAVSLNDSPLMDSFSFIY